MDLLFITNPCGCYDLPLTWADGCAVATLLVLVGILVFLIHWGDIKETRRRAKLNAFWKASRKDEV